MAEWFGKWILSVTAAAVFVALCGALIPSGSVKKIAGLTGGLILLLSVLSPILRLEPGALTAELEGREELRLQETERLEEANIRYQQELIEEQTAAYISDKGAELALELSPRVETRLEEGIPIPDRAILETPYHAVLSEYMETELGIPKERQEWKD